MTPSNWDDELAQLKKSIANRLQQAADHIVKEETAKILGRVKIITHTDLNRDNYDWFIKKEDTNG